MEKKTKYLLWGLGAVAVGTGGFFLFKHLLDKKEENRLRETPDIGEDAPYAPPASSGSSKQTTSKKQTVYNQFPLAYGSKGTLVRDIQTVLNKRYNAGIDVDGDWQGQTESALQKFNLPTSFDSQGYAKFIAGTSATDQGSKTATPPSSKGGWSAKYVAKKLQDSIDKNDVTLALAALKMIHNKSQYQAANTEFKKTKTWSVDYTYGAAPVSKTIVNAMLGKFGSAEYKKKINAEFYRIGLKYDGDKWSLAGLLAGTTRLQTIAPAQVWDARGNRLTVPRATIIGTFIRAKNGVTEFETLDGRILYANTIQIKYAA